MRTISSLTTFRMYHGEEPVRLIFFFLTTNCNILHKCRPFSEKVTRAMQGRNNTQPAELPQDGTSVHPAGSGAGPSTTVDPAQAGIENIKKVVAEVAGIQWRNSDGEVTASPP